ncbi:SDR family oxidoreductase [Granulicella sibirica]|uniref:3-oxoacyl-[acyl-carrier protein] reductase n=1 Tax=Granulicella sibirica TaxID=2479048 RepID=A0A4Q0T3T6_9BACT|nr:SDR family oxidoreductase [Granulicella sibirica]RXH56196.1 3-oxoacyl-[acyl-carrier protein] reductase [Granulicella sibirica]
MSKLNGKVAVITGGTTGIGLAIAERFVAEGAFVFITGRRQAELDLAKAALGDSVVAVQGDVSKMEDLDRLYEVVHDVKGTLDIVVANAGIVENLPLEAVTTELYDRMFNINTRGLFFTVQKSLPLLKDGASIVLVGSSVSGMGMPATSVYTATKAAVCSFARTFAADLKGRKIRVNTLSPGPIDTPIIDGQFRTAEEAAAGREQMASLPVLGRLGTAEEMASAAFFLASDESSYCTGIDLYADGGLSQRF